MNNKISFMKNLMWAAAAFVVIVCISVSFTVMCRQIYYYDINNLRIPQRTGISEDICRDNYDILIDYNMIISPDTLEFEDFTLSSTERIHFEEVKKIFVTMQVISIGGIIALIGKVWLQIRKNDKDFRWLKYILLLGVVIVGSIALLVVTNWKLAFLLMHKVFFRNDYWIFDVREGGIINILPDTFFMHCGIVIMVLTVIMSVGTYVLFKYLNK